MKDGSEVGVLLVGKTESVMLQISWVTLDESLTLNQSLGFKNLELVLLPQLGKVE